jgi:hypothetical protein
VAEHAFAAGPAQRRVEEAQAPGAGGRGWPPQRQRQRQLGGWPARCLLGGRQLERLEPTMTAGTAAATMSAGRLAARLTAGGVSFGQGGGGQSRRRPKALAEKARP